MKKFILLLFVAVACTQVENFEKTFYLSSEETRTSYNEGKVTFNDGDIINYFVSSKVEQGRIGSKQLSVSLPFGYKYFTGFYNANPIDISEDYAKISICPINQSGNFEGAHISIARGLESDNILNFKNLTSMIKFTLEDSNVDYIIFKTKSNISDCSVELLFDEYNFTYNFTAKSNNIIIDPEDIGTYYISLLPGKIEGFQIEFFDYNGESLGTVETDKTLILKNNSIINIGVLQPSSTINENTISIEDIPEVLSTNSSNSYITAVGKDYNFDTKYKGNTKKLVGTRSYAKILWSEPAETISDFRYEKGKIYFHTNSAGNSLIGIYDKQDNLLWTWYIWTLDEDIELLQLGEYTIMDRNIGDISSKKSSGIVFKWGNRNPMTDSKSPITESGTWGSEKTIDDPCPTGYKVPGKIWNLENSEYITGGRNISNIFFPYTISYDIHGNRGEFSGNYWTSEVKDDFAVSLYFNFNKLYGYYNNFKDNCYSVRCIKE